MRRGSKIALYVGLALVSVGVLAGLAALARRQRVSEVPEEAAPTAEEAATAEEQARIEEAAEEILGEYVAAMEPSP